ncbi:MAG: hypothetical protein JNK25_03765 [Phycisphaerae bacterium]|nr:hypothetical protein [Phycisphaerae bacterium]
MPQPPRDNVGGETLHPVLRARCPHVVEQPGPGLHARSSDDFPVLGPQVHRRIAQLWDYRFHAHFGVVEQVVQDQAQLGGDRHNPNRLAFVVGRLRASHRHPALVPNNVTPPQPHNFGRAAQARERVDFGRWGTVESREKHDRAVVQWLASDRRPEVDAMTVCIAEIAAAFGQHAVRYCRRADLSSIRVFFNGCERALSPLVPRHLSSKLWRRASTETTD